MKKLIVIFAIAMLTVSFAVPAMADDDDRVIQVKGSAVVSLAADTASIQIGVNTRKETVKEAQKENAALMNAVMEAIKGSGIDENNITTSQFNVYSSYEYGTDVLGREIRTLYYEVQNSVTVTISDLTQVGAVLDAAMEAGANTTYGIAFSSTKANEAYQKALTRAVEDAMAKAQVLAAAAGVNLGPLIRINAVQDSVSFARDVYGISNSYYYSAKAADQGTAISSGDISVSAEVVLEYGFQ